MGSTVLRTAFIILLVLIVLYGLYVGYFYAMQRTILFPRHLIAVPTGVAEQTPGLEKMPLEMAFGTVEAWFLPPMPDTAHNPAPAFIVAHGNGELIDFWAEPVAGLRARGFAVLLVEYPGYGRSAGRPSQATITATFTRAYDRLVKRPDVDADRIVFFGRSVGGAAVATLTEDRPSAALILLSTFSSVRTMATSYRLPGWLVRDPFDTLQAVRDYPNPILLLHGEHDAIIPFSHAVTLHEAAPDATLVPLECGHNDCITHWDAFWQSLMPFLADAGVVGE